MKIGISLTPKCQKDRPVTYYYLSGKKISTQNPDGNVHNSPEKPVKWSTSKKEEEKKDDVKKTTKQGSQKKAYPLVPLDKLMNKSILVYSPDICIKQHSAQEYQCTLIPEIKINLPNCGPNVSPVDNGLIVDSPLPIKTENSINKKATEYISPHGTTLCPALKVATQMPGRQQPLPTRITPDIKSLPAILTTKKQHQPPLIEDNRVKPPPSNTPLILNRCLYYQTKNDEAQRNRSEVTEQDRNTSPHVLLHRTTMTMAEELEHEMRNRRTQKPKGRLYSNRPLAELYSNQPNKSTMDQSVMRVEPPPSCSMGQKPFPDQPASCVSILSHLFDSSNTGNIASCPTRCSTHSGFESLLPARPKLFAGDIMPCRTFRKRGMLHETDQKPVLDMALRPSKNKTHFMPEMAPLRTLFIGHQRSMPDNL